MSSATATGPLTLGRWQEPAALIQAGLAPPDPYPLEKILYCASCDQQFFGTHVAGGVRAYRSQCGCQLRPLPATQVELRTYAEAQRLTFGTDTVTGLSDAHCALLAVRLFTRVSLGTTANDITFVTRI
jgi:hypothetical protein